MNILEHVTREREFLPQELSVVTGYENASTFATVPKSRQITVFSELRHLLSIAEKQRARSTSHIRRQDWFPPVTRPGGPRSIVMVVAYVEAQEIESVARSRSVFFIQFSRQRRPNQSNSEGSS